MKFIVATICVFVNFTAFAEGQADVAINAVRTLCLAGTGYEMVVDGDASITIFKKGINGKLSYSSRDLTGVVDVPENDKKLELNNIRECTSPHIEKIVSFILGKYVVKNDNTDSSFVSEYVENGFQFRVIQCASKGTQMKCQIEVENKSKQVDMTLQSADFIKSSKKGFTRMFTDKGIEYRMSKLEMNDMDSKKSIEYTYLPNIPLTVYVSFQDGSYKTNYIPKIELRFFGRGKGLAIFNNIPVSNES